MSAQERCIPISRAEAKALGLKTYFTGRSCEHGSIAERRVSDARCRCDACVAAWKKVDQDYYTNNRDRCLSRDRFYYAENREAIIERRKSHSTAGTVSGKERTRRYRERNPESVEATRLRYRKNNPDAGRIYYANHKHEYVAQSAKRRAIQRARVPSWFDEFDAFVIDEAFALSAERRRATGLKWHVDHMVPLLCRKASGLHCGWNIHVIPEYLNRKKNNKLWLHEPDQWICQLKAERA